MVGIVLFCQGLLALYLENVGITKPRTALYISLRKRVDLTHAYRVALGKTAGTHRQEGQKRCPEIMDRLARDGHTRLRSLFAMYPGASQYEQKRDVSIYRSGNRFTVYLKSSVFL